MKISKLKTLEFYQRAMERIAIGNRGVNSAIPENERKGLPNVFGIKNKIYYLMPVGTVTTKVHSKK
jgi:hypothetical protein